MITFNAFNFMDTGGFNLSLGDSQTALAIGICVMAVGFILSILFCLSLFNTMQSAPKSARQFPSWFAWLLLVPAVGIVFQWMMLPFGIPNTLKRAAHGKKGLEDGARTLFAFGLVQVIISTFIASSHKLTLIVTGNDDVILHVKGTLTIVCAVFWVLYWFKLVSLRKKYLHK